MKKISVEIIDPKANKLLSDLEDQKLIKIESINKVKESSVDYGSIKAEYTAIIKQDKDWWIGWIEEIPGVNCQEKTYDSLLKSLKNTLKEALEYNRKDALESAGKVYKEQRIEISIINDILAIKICKDLGIESIK